MSIHSITTRRREVWYRLTVLVTFALGTAAGDLARPLGASSADWFGQEHDVGGGLGYGDGPVAGVMLLAIVALVAYVVRQESLRATPVPGLGRPGPPAADQASSSRTTQNG